MRILTPESSRLMPWANGLGQSLEIASDAESHHSIHNFWTWRLSIADVPTRAAFSNFSGIDRWIACLHGDGLRIDRNGIEVMVPHSGDALSFAGEEIVFGDPIGEKVKDVNWFVRRDRWKGGMQVLREIESKQVDKELIVIHSVAGMNGAMVRSHQQTTVITPGFTVLARGKVLIECDPSSVFVLAWVTAR